MAATTMRTMVAVSIIEDGDPEVEPEVYIEAWQSLIDSGVVWQLQGSYGRMAVALIEAGECCSE